MNIFSKYIMFASWLLLAGCNPFGPHEECRILQAETIAVNCDPKKLDRSLVELGGPPCLRLQTRQHLELIVSQYRSKFPDAAVSDEELEQTLIDSKVRVSRESQRIVITVKSHNEKLAADFADIYAVVCEEMSCARTNLSYSGLMTIVKRVEDR